MSELVLFITVVLLIVLYLLSTIMFPPSNFPKNIPTIPFYVSFLGTYTSMDQKDILEKYLRVPLEKHGAVKIYFAARWNIVVSKPELLRQIFKDDRFSKSGNQIKIPNAILSKYTGDNIISSNGEVWKLYRKILTAPIKFPNLEFLESNTSKFINLIKVRVEEMGNIIFIGDLVQRLMLENIGQAMLGMSFRTLEEKGSSIHNKVTMVKSQIFKPIFMNFPQLDSLPIPSRQKARVLVDDFRNEFSKLVKNSQVVSQDLSSVSHHLTDALQKKLLTEKQFTDNAMIVMIAGHENPQLLLNSLLYVVAKHEDVQNKMREELLSQVPKNEQYYVMSVIYETLRLFPPLGQIVNRRTTECVILGENIIIPKGAYVGYNNFVTGRDRTVWENADSFVPGRWGNNIIEVNRNYSLAKSSAKLPAFHGGKRACLGEKFALMETQNIISELLHTYRIALDPNWPEKFTPSGPICPLKLKLKVEHLH